MAAITIRGKDGFEAKIEARRFSHYIGNIRYWFAYHKPYKQPMGLQVTHIDSGFKVCDASGLRMACLGDDKAAAKMALDQLIERVGAERVRSVINSAVAK